MSKSLGIPVKLLHEAEGHIVTVELKSGEVYRGSLIECEDNWNSQLESITYTAKVSFRVYPGLFVFNPSFLSMAVWRIFIFLCFRSM
jgi:small nuclear ribonucleoprotein (snRNP)-like protein